ncbi:MAG TPA: VOC family protein [Gemmatimonadaceae bacterium]
MRVAGVLETCLYAIDLAAAERFYADVLGLEVFSREPERHVFFRCGDAMFLVFNPTRTSTGTSEVNGAAVPRHGTSGPGHTAFRIAEHEMPAWRARLSEAGIRLEAEVVWPSGGRSLYLRDPAGNSVELATPAIWHLSETPR